MCRHLVDGVVLVDNSAISAAIKDVFNETRSILEPAGAVAVAGAKAYLKRHGLQVQPHSHLQCVLPLTDATCACSSGALMAHGAI